MVSPKHGKMLRRRQVRERTGWSNRYITKLIHTGVLRTWRPPGDPQAQYWFYEEQIETFLADPKRMPA